MPGCNNTDSRSGSDISFWLPWPQKGRPEVSIVWRADETDDALQLAVAETEEGDEKAREEEAGVRARIEACPPTSPEALSVSPLAWSQVGYRAMGASAAQEVDVEGAATGDGQAQAQEVDVEDAASVEEPSGQRRDDPAILA